MERGRKEEAEDHDFSHLLSVYFVIREGRGASR